MKSEYTKGEWMAHKEMKVTGQAGLTYVADCYPFNSKMNRPSLPEAQANARLIAQAPKLYETLKEIAGWLKHHADLVGANCEERDMLAIINKVIAPVEGK